MGDGEFDDVDEEFLAKLGTTDKKLLLKRLKKAMQQQQVSDLGGFWEGFVWLRDDGLIDGGMTRVSLSLVDTSCREEEVERKKGDRASAVVRRRRRRTSTRSIRSHHFHHRRRRRSEREVHHHHHHHRPPHQTQRKEERRSRRDDMVNLRLAM